MESSVRIILDSGRNKCYPGQTIVGRVQCYFNSEKTIRGIRIKFKGRAKTKWTSGGGNSKTTYKGKEVYFDAAYILIGGEFGEMSIPAGMHTYPFSYILPSRLPGTFTGSDGDVAYKIKATVDRPWKFDFEDKVYFFVVSPLDLNRVIGARDPFLQSTEDILSCCCMKSGSITLSVSLPVTGYVRGQTIDVCTTVLNMSSTNVDNVVYELKRKEEFISQTPYTQKKHKDYVISVKYAGSLDAHVEKTWTSSLDIPLDNVANLQDCDIINISYFLKVKLILPLPYVNLKITCPLTFGTVPLSRIHSNTSESFSRVNSNRTATAPNSEELPQYFDVCDSGKSHNNPTAPPSYEDVVYT